MKVNELIKSHINEDLEQEVAAIEAQLATLSLKKAKLTKVIDDQIRILQQQLAVKTQQVSQQGKGGVVGQAQNRPNQATPGQQSPTNATPNIPRPTNPLAA